ncbi:DUF2059 domain-containing protein [Chryseobacterium sp. YIM B08800]|uniref:DUF2059 domain-containing protein n=1 Tax=Chryseobacterium sp. YIM B08800 TaxID=2984136 RepID=UPI00223EE9BB|nr:DUF2059 domain-containing protein [Chryseobacterium sp. YIM B08800]
MRKFFCISCFLFSVFSYSQTKHDKIKELISLSGAFKLSKEIEKDVLLNFKKRYTNIPDSVWSSLEPKINIDDLINQVIGIYGNKFTEKEIDELLTFYNSELGQKFIKNSPDIMTEVQNATADWAKNINDLVNKDLEDKGYLQSPPPPSPNPPAPMIPKKK